MNDILLYLISPDFLMKAPVRGMKRPAAREEENLGSMKERRLYLEAQEAQPDPTHVSENVNATLHPTSATSSYLATPINSQTWTTPPTLPTTPITYHTTNPYSSFIMPYPPTSGYYYSPYPYHIPTFYHPNTPPTQWRTPSHIPKSGSSSQSQNSK